MCGINQRGLSRRCGTRGGAKLRDAQLCVFFFGGSFTVHYRKDASPDTVKMQYLTDVGRWVYRYRGVGSVG